MCGGETFRSEPAAQGGAGAGCRLYEKGFRAEPVDANNHHVNVAEPSSRVIARARWGRAAQSLLEPRPCMRAHDRAARMVGRSIAEGHALANVIVLKMVAERGRDLRVAVDPQAIGGAQQRGQRDDPTAGVGEEALGASLVRERRQRRGRELVDELQCVFARGEDHAPVSEVGPGDGDAERVDAGGIGRRGATGGFEHGVDGGLGWMRHGLDVARIPQNPPGNRRFHGGREGPGTVSPYHAYRFTPGPRKNPRLA